VEGRISPELGWIEKALRAYCGQDTLALARLLERLLPM
jgi:hypothetical protein